jgi:cytochrome c-type biogenesis protein
VFQAVRRNSRWVTRIGGAMLIVVGLALVLGAWEPFMVWLRSVAGAGTVPI